MSGDSIEERLDAMLAPLRDRPAQLDELTQARVRAHLEAELAKAVDAADARSARGWRRGGVAAALGVAAAAVFAVIVAVSGGEPRTGTRSVAGKPAPTGSAATVVGDGAVGGSVAGTAAGTNAIGATATPPSAANAAGAAPGANRPASIATSAEGTAADTSVPITVAAGESAQLTLGGAAVTVYGPGRLSPTPEGAVVEAAGIVVDRTHGDKPWSVRYHGVKVVAMYATFAVDHSTATRVTVMRGEIVLYCPSSSRTIRSGTSGTCEPAVRSHVTPAPRPPASSLEKLQVPDPQPRPEPFTADSYAVAEAALRHGDLDAARKALLAIVDATPDSLDAATALFDLARLAATHGDPSGALGYLDRLDRHPRRAVLAVAAAHLRATLPQSPIIDLRVVP
jgi:hypothetical protein